MSGFRSWSDGSCGGIGEERYGRPDLALEQPDDATHDAGPGEPGSAAAAHRAGRDCEAICFPPGTVTAVERVDLTIGEGEFFSLLGPSGCGKTTTLRMIGGFEEPTEGQILLYGVDVVGVPPNRRDVNMVFQSYALFPHMSVFDNVAFGLRRKSVDSAEVRRRVNEMLELVQLEGKSDRRPRELSGGQQQRVALARALVNKPRALLLDEPLAALDLKLRQQMQIELKRIQREVGITFIFVTHDQNEALTMSDRLVVMNAGRIEQLGSPREVYERPRTRFVAGFIGTSNLITGNVALRRHGGGARDGRRRVDRRPRRADAGAPRSASRSTSLCGPEKILLSTAPSRRRALRDPRTRERGRLSRHVHPVRRAHADGWELLVFLQNASDADDIAERGQDVWLSWRPEHSLAARPPRRPTRRRRGGGA